MDEQRSFTNDVDLAEEAHMAQEERRYPPNTPGYERLLAHARGFHGTKPGTQPHSECEACQQRRNMTQHKATIYQDADGGWRWRVQAANGEIVSEGESYTEHGNAVRGLKTAHPEFEGSDFSTGSAEIEV